MRFKEFITEATLAEFTIGWTGYKDDLTSGEEAEKQFIAWAEDEFPDCLFRAFWQSFYINHATLTIKGSARSIELLKNRYVIIYKLSRSNAQISRHLIDNATPEFQDSMFRSIRINDSLLTFVETPADGNFRIASPIRLPAAHAHLKPNIYPIVGAVSYYTAIHNPKRITADVSFGHGAMQTADVISNVYLEDFSSREELEAEAYKLIKSKYYSTNTNLNIWHW